jgi:hypothetical protein
VFAELDMCDGVEGAFGTGPQACTPKSSPSQVRLNESTPMSQSYHLFSEGSRKRHPRALAFDYLSGSLWFSGIVFVIFAMRKHHPLL